MSDISVVGTGAMGSALVEALAASGLTVAVWNRTTAKSERLSGSRVCMAKSLAEALTSSPLTIVALSNYEVTRTLLTPATEQLRGRVLASTSYLTLEQSAAFATYVRAAGGHYLDLAIAAEPAQVRTRAGVLLVSGDEAAYRLQRETFERVGSVVYVSGPPGAAFVTGMALAAAYLPMAVALVQGLRITQTLNQSPGSFREAVLAFYPLQIERLFDQVAGKCRVEGSVDSMAEWASDYVALFGSMNLDAGVFEALHDLFRAASAVGLGDADWTRAIEWPGPP